MRGVTTGFLAGALSKVFQLTRLMRGVTFLYKIKNENISYFNSHASCEA